MVHRSPALAAHAHPGLGHCELGVTAYRFAPSSSEHVDPSAAHAPGRRASPGVGCSLTARLEQMVPRDICNVSRDGSRRCSGDT